MEKKNETPKLGNDKNVATQSGLNPFCYCTFFRGVRKGNTSLKQVKIRWRSTDGQTLSKCGKNHRTNQLNWSPNASRDCWMVEGPVDPKATGTVESIFRVKPGGTKTDGQSSMSSPFGPEKTSVVTSTISISIRYPKPPTRIYQATHRIHPDRWPPGYPQDTAAFCAPVG